MPDAAIFDFDGVICDSEPAHYAAFNQTLEPLGIHISKHDYYDKYLGYSDVELIAQLFKELGRETDNRQIETIAREKMITFERIISGTDCIYDGVRELLELLNGRNIPCAICSGALMDDINAMLKGCDILKFFEVIVTADDVKRCKPDPEGYLTALTKLNAKHSGRIRPGNAVAIEDSLWGLQAARKAGLKTIAVTNSYRADELVSADLIVSGLGELTIDKIDGICDK